VHQRHSLIGVDPERVAGPDHHKISVMRVLNGLGPRKNLTENEKCSIIVMTRGRLGSLKCTKSRVCWGFAPDPTGGAYKRSPDELTVLPKLPSWI